MLHFIIYILNEPFYEVDTEAYLWATEVKWQKFPVLTFGYQNFLTLFFLSVVTNDCYVSDG